ncbi:hypothetical protein BOTBODRAFT_137152 [Botryobasidium botryosum FD-172 SS1]|uniref:Uncharacterized protein n=1 Tax=Botryobasidium botryosum (strain FD-172 SS1) TaxID=930990 RepID=A0A067M5R5_BOTB1|nr:hypothetical protein BOTBODRAFT_137152 [Botryobasidium botryosum FD-172 SS1]
MWRHPDLERIEKQDDGWLRWAEREGRFYPLPFVEDKMPFSPHGDNDDIKGEVDLPRTLIELKMNTLSSVLRDKPSWIQKSRDPQIIGKWRKEVHLQQEGLPAEHQLTPSMVDYVLSELAGYAKLFDETTGIEMGCCERIWKSDSLVSTELRNALLKCVARLEDVPEAEKDWHPKSNDKVLDLVHPSLYPLVYGRTRAYNPSDNESLLLTCSEPADMFNSAKYQWLPADFDIDVEGKATLVSPYINNVDRVQHGALYKVIERLVGAAVPMWNRVLSDLRRPLTPPRIQTSLILDSSGYKFEYYGVECIWFDDPIRAYPHEDGQWDNAEYHAWTQAQPKRLPQALAKYDGALDVIKQTVDLSNSRIQVIVKLANIVLTAEKPSYPGGSWHVEGMKNESIVSTFIYYYDEENVTESQLAFRAAVCAPTYHMQDDSMCMGILYGLDRGKTCVQHRGHIFTREGRCIAFPNIYQHQVQPFELADKTKPGHRKIVAFFLIDPTRKIPSTTDVPPQRREDYCDLLMKVPAMHKLPPEIILIICELAEAGFTRKEAEQFRLQLMAERSKAAKRLDTPWKGRFGREMNMCEH